MRAASSRTEANSKGTRKRSGSSKARPISAVVGSGVAGDAATRQSVPSNAARSPPKTRTPAKTIRRHFTSPTILVRLRWGYLETQNQISLTQYVLKPEQKSCLMQNRLAKFPKKFKNVPSATKRTPWWDAASNYSRAKAKPSPLRSRGVIPTAGTSPDSDAPFGPAM